MKKSILLITLLIFLVSCTPSHQTDQYTGSRGVEFDFSSNMPPNNVLVGDRVYFGFDIVNRGAHSLEGGKQGVIMLDFNPIYFDSDSDQITVPFHDETNRRYESFNVRGKDPGYTAGERTMVNLGFARANIPGTRESVSTELNANICYPYRTFLSDVVCIDTNVFDQVSDPLCRSRVKGYSSQGAPVAITRVSPTMMPIEIIDEETETTVSVVDEDGQFWGLERETVSTQHVILKPAFEIQIRNVGGGTPFYSEDRTIEQTCLRSDDSRRVNQVRIFADMDGLELECTPQFVDLNDGVTRCELPDDDLFATPSSYQAVLNLELEYYYLDSESKRINIQRVG